MRDGSVRSPEAATVQLRVAGSGHQRPAEEQRKYADAEPGHDMAHSAAHRCCPARYLQFTHIDKYLCRYLDIYCVSQNVLETDYEEADMMSDKTSLMIRFYPFSTHPPNSSLYILDHASYSLQHVI